MRSHDRPLNLDEWPNLSSLDAPRGARFADGEPVGPLTKEAPSRWLRLRFAFGAAFLLGSVAFRACGG